MEDISGKKFSLQDWVMKRAANQSGVNVPSSSVRQTLSEQEAELEEKLAEAPAEELSTTMQVEVEMKAVSNGSAIKASSLSREETREEAQKPAAKEKESGLSPFAHSNNPLQQLQIVRLLTDLGDRLRQSEKEREVLWKEVEICRKQIADMGGRENKSEKSYSNLETQMNQREVFVKELVEKQIGLEQKLKEQVEAFESSKKEQGKWVDKLTSVETAAGSAIVRVEDVVAENAKLAKKVEQLGQDKVRLTRKLEIVEETLTQTQDILKAKALVLLTDQAVAAKTNLPQTPAWTGDDTLKVSESAAAVVSGEMKKEAAGPVSDIAASLRPKSSFKIQPSTAILAGLVVLGIAGGIVGSQYFKSANKMQTAPMEEIVPTQDENLEPLSEGSKTEESAVTAKPAALSQDELMAEAAKIANQIEPGSTDAAAGIEGADGVAVATGVLPKEFESAQVAQDKAVADYNEVAPTAPLTERIKSDKNLPRGIIGIENKAFSGDGNAQHDLAAIYTAGHAGVKVNYTKAAQWFEAAAYNNIPNAQYNLGVLYHQGLGVKKDTAKAMQLYRVAASHNHPEAQYNLAIAYVEGVGAEYNPQIAAVYFEQAAASGVVEAAYNLGLLHENGLLGESQPDEAIFWYTVAAEKGNEDAIKALGQLKSQLSMSDDDADRVAHKIAAARPLFADEDGNPILPDAKPATQQAEVEPLAIAPQGDKQMDDVVKAVAKPVAKAGTKAAKADPVIISQIQEQLIRLGFYKGQPNGTESPVLSQAIKTYQQKNGLKVDGKASDDLLVNMLAASTERKVTSAQ
jgi:TPR repeat protein